MSLARISSRIAATGALFLLGCSATPAPVAAPSASTPSGAIPSADDVEARVDGLLAAMTRDEKLAYVGGQDEFFIRAIERLGIPRIKLADGPAGCRNWGPSTAYPAPVGVAASFDTTLAGEVGRAIARDCRARGVHVLLAPGMNIQRSPVTGRNFEYFGEDPHLAASLGTAFVQAVQEGGVVATAKHFAANNQEWDRNHVSSQVDERTLREIYLPAFEAVVREGHVGAVMSAYNPVNGIFSSHHPWLLRQVLKQEWGFQGLVMSDWVAVHDPLGGAVGGCDLEMPRAIQMSPANLGVLLDTGSFTEQQLDDKVRRILRTIVAAGFLDREQTPAGASLDDPTSRSTALAAARQSIVLLKNEEQILPLDRKTLRRLAIVGPNAHPAVHGGSGSAYVTPLHTVSVKEGLAAVAPGVQLAHHPGIQRRTKFNALGDAVFSGPVKQEVFAGQQLEGAPVAVLEVDRIDFDPADGEAPATGVGPEHYSIRWSGQVRLPKAGTYDVMTNADDGIRVFVDGRLVLDDWSDHAPRTQVERVSLTRGAHEVVVEYFQGIFGAIAQFGIGPAQEADTRFGAESLARVAREADAVVVCVGFGQSADTNSLARRFQPFWPPDWAREANLVESENSDRDFALPDVQRETLDVVTRNNPRTIVVVNAGGGVDFEGWLDGVPGLVWAWYPGQEGGTAVAEILFGATNPSAKLPITLAKRYEDHPSAPYYNVNEGGSTPYTERLLVGYRGFDAAGVEPEFPFGHGLSYTQFEYSRAQVVRRPSGDVAVTFTVTNAGTRPGAEAAQIYVAPPTGHDRPPQKLEGFAKPVLAPGAAERVTVVLPPRAFAYWSDGWQIDAGSYEIRIGASSRDPRLVATVELPESRLEL